MKTALHIITGLDDGGAQTVLFRLCTAKQHIRHEVISLTGRGKYGALLEAAGIPVHALELPRGRVTLAGLWQLWRRIRQSRAEVLQTWMYHSDLLGGVVGRLTRKSNIFWGIHNSTLDPAHSSHNTILVAKACAWLSRLVPRRIICCAEASRQVHAQLGYDHDRIEVIPNGYDLTVFRPDPAAGAALRAELGLDLARPLIGFVARFDPQKDHATLLQALALLQRRQIRPICLLVGEGADQNNARLTKIVTDLGLAEQILLLGPRRDIPAVMNALDLHVMSSSFGEAFPNVLAEAMACGTPCVSTDIGDAAQILGQIGRIVPVRDPAALADAIAELLILKEGSDWAARCQAARQHIAAHFSIDVMAESYRRAWFG